MSALRWLVAIGTVVLGLIALGALVAVFIFGYMACFRPGPDDALGDAAMVSVALAFIAGLAAFLAGVGTAVLWEDA